MEPEKIKLPKPKARRVPPAHGKTKRHENKKKKPQPIDFDELKGA